MASASRDSDAMDVDALALCALQFGVTREQAAGYCTDEGPSRSAASSSTETVLAQLLAAITAPRLFKGAQPGRNKTGVAAGGLLKNISEELISSRKKANLCAKCGVVRYERGATGHNARTCKAPPDATTSIAEGLKRAGAKSDF